MAVFMGPGQTFSQTLVFVAIWFVFRPSRKLLN